MNFNEYQSFGRAAYADLSTTIAIILSAAIEAEGGYRLQQVKERAKQIDSLLKKLEQRGIAATAALENDIKDLAGCRTVFYTNSDVIRFINSGIIHQNFDVLETKLHQPGRKINDAAELYISNHYIVSLKQERIDLPEYSRFAGMRCEIQIQTILNHAWAEMAHDTIYKAPTLDSFGGKEFEGIKNRMQKVARKYLVPAGYEFQKIANDFQRLIDGKALFDGDALDAIVHAGDNNVRAEAIEKFAENVLPFYDDLIDVYPDIALKLLASANNSKRTHPVTIETPYGTLKAKTHKDILEAIAQILMRYRYMDIGVTFDVICSLYLTAESDEERKPIINLGKALAQHQKVVWEQYGLSAQIILINHIEGLGEDSLHELKPLLIEMLQQILGLEISGTTSNFDGFIIHRGTVVASEELRVVRVKAIELLKHLFMLAVNNMERGTVLLGLQTAIRGPRGAGYTKELARILLENTKVVLEFLTVIAPDLEYQLLQTAEESVLRCFWMYAELPTYLGDVVDLEAARIRAQSAALEFCGVANANPDYVIYKTLVGFNSVFPPAWLKKDFHYDEAEAYRVKQVACLLQTVDEDSAGVWFARINRFSQTESNDAATFPVLMKFLEQMAEEKPAIVLKFIDHIEGALQNFLPSMLLGLARSAERKAALSQVDLMLKAGKYISDIAWYLRFTDKFDESLLCRTLDSAIARGDLRAVRNSLVAAVTQFNENPGNLIEKVFFPAFSVLVSKGDFSWVRMQWFTWYRNPLIEALDEEQSRVVLKGLVNCAELIDGAEHIAASIATRWPEQVVSFIGERQLFAQTDDAPPRYNAIPFSIHELRLPLASVPAIMLEAAQIWFNRSPQYFAYDGGKLISSVFPDIKEGLEEGLKALIATGNDLDKAFVLRVLSAYEGKHCVYELVRLIVASLTPNNALLQDAKSALNETGMVSGEFGLVELYSERKVLLRTWLEDPSELVRHFADELIRTLDQRIAAENRSAEASIALRKLEWGQDLDSENIE